MLRLRRTGHGMLALDALLIVTLVFLFLPLVVVFPVSITPSSYFRFPPAGLSGRWYGDFFGDRRWLDAAWLSLRLALASSLVATVLAVGAGIAVTRVRFPGRELVRALFVSPLVVPVVITGTALLRITAELGLEGGFLGLLLGHIVIGVPLAFVLIESALRRYDTSLEEAAMGLGASRWQAFRRITMPVIAPAVAAGGLFAFLASWDDVVIALYLVDATTRTLPLRMLEYMTTQIRPTTAAVSSLLIVLLFGGMLAYTAVVDRRRRHRQVTSRAER